MKKFEEALFRPRMLIKYYNTKFWRVLLYAGLLALLLIIPTTISNSFRKHLSYNEQYLVRLNFNRQALDYQITNGVLKPTQANAIKQIAIPELQTYVIFTTDNELYRHASPLQTALFDGMSLYLVTESGLYTSGIITQRKILAFPESSYFQNFEVKELANFDSPAWEQLFKVINSDRETRFAGKMVTQTIFFYAVSLLRVLFLAGLMAVITSLGLNHIINLKNYYYLAVYAMTFLVVSETLGNLFELWWLKWVGYIISFIYVIRIRNTLIQMRINPGEQDGV